MLPSGTTVVLSRILVTLLGLAVWFFYYQEARLAYRHPRGTKKSALQLSFVFGSVGVVILQIKLMERLTPMDARGSYFLGFILIECGGALVVLFSTLLRERAKSIKVLHRDRAATTNEC